MLGILVHFLQSIPEVIAAMFQWVHLQSEVRYRLGGQEIQLYRQDLEVEQFHSGEILAK
jgi:hypothetical protein